MATKPSRNRPSWADMTGTDDEHEKETDPGFVPEVRQEAMQTTAEVPKVDCQDGQVHDKGEKNAGSPQKLATPPWVPPSSAVVKPSRNRPSWADMTDTDDEHEKETDPGFVPEVRQEAMQTTEEVPKVDCQDGQVHDKGEKNAGSPQKLATPPWVPPSSAVVNDEIPSHAECQESSYAGPPANMWIFEKADPEIHVEAWLDHSCWVMKKGENMCLRLATVCPRDRQASLCAECQQPCRHHHRQCKYQGQIPCAYCNKLPCKHGRTCSRKNFGCNFCHFDSISHCIPNQIDVQKYKLNSWSLWPSWP